jgi:hypothetical protein
MHIEHPSTYLSTHIINTKMSFDLKKYLAEGKLLKEDTGVDMILSPD